MPDDNPSPDLLREINERLKYLESVVSEQISRLYAIEQKLGIAYRPQAARTTPPEPSRETDIERGGVEATRRRSSVPAQPVERPPQPGSAEPGLPQPPVSPLPPYESRLVPPPGRPIQPSAADKPPAGTSTPLLPPKTEAGQQPPSALGAGTPPETPPLHHSPAGPGGQTPAGPPRRSALNIPPPQGPPPPQSAHRAQAPLKRRGDFESRIGGKLFNWIGVIAICIGVGFFLKLAFERAWIGPTGRVFIGVAIGLGFLIAGERLRKRYAGYAYGLTGGGILILYLTFYAAKANYHLIEQPVAFVLMAVVTAIASLLSARYNALPIAILGFIGGFITPILLSTGEDNERGLFWYITFLDLGVLALAYSKHWRILNYLSFTATVLMIIGYMTSFPWSPNKLGTTFSFFTGFFVIFALLAVLYNVVNRQTTRWLDLALVFINAILYFGATYELLEDDYHGYLGLFAVLVSAFYLALGYFTYRRDRQDRLLIFTFLGLAFLFLVLAVPIQLDQHWVTMAWAIEGAIMTWIGLKVNDRTSRYAALVVFIIAVSHWAIVDELDFAYRTGDVFTPLFNRRAASSMVLALAMAVAAWFYKRYASEVEDSERSMFRALYLLGANSLAVILLSLDANDYFEQAKAVASDRSWQELERLNNNRHATLSALWSLYGGTALIVGIVRGLKPLRYAALLLLALATCKVLAVDLPYFDAPWHHRTLFNQTFAAFAVLIVAMAFAAWFYARSKEVESEERSVFVPLLIAAANLLAVIALSAEAIGHFERIKVAGEQTANLAGIENTKQLALSAVWTVYAAACLIIGIARRKRALRIGALILLGLATAKLLVVDLWYYRAPWHTTIFNQSFAAFALLIVALATCAWLYSKREGISDRERAFVIPLLVGVANLLGVIALSAEAVGHFERAKAGGGSWSGLENTKQLVLTALWSVHGAAALIVGIKRKSSSLRWGALVLLALATVKVLGIDLLRFYTEPDHTLIFNQTFGAVAVLIAGLAAGAWSYRRSEGLGEVECYTAIGMLATCANVLAVIGLSAEAVGYFGRAKSRLGEQQDSALERVRLDNSEQFWLSALWSIYGGAALVVGIKRRINGLRWGALLLLAIATAKLLLVDARYYDAEFHSLVFNQTFGAFSLLIAMLACGVWFYARSDETEVAEGAALVPITMAVANILAIIGLSVEASGYFKKQMKTGGILAETFRDLRLAEQLSLSVVWTIYGGVLLTTGILRHNRLLRMMALLLLSLTIVKVFLFDLSSLDKVYRIISFIVLGAILLTVSFLYQRFRQRWVESPESDAVPRTD